MRRLKPKGADSRAIYVISFLLPALFVVLSLVTIYYTEGGNLPPSLTLRTGLFDQKFIYSAQKDYDYVKTSPDLRSVIQNAFDIGVMIAVLFKGTLSFMYFKILFLIRFGLMGLTMFFFMKKTLKEDDSASIFLSVCYALSAASLLGCQDRQITDMMIFLPLAAYGADGVLRRRDIRDFLEFSLFTALMVTSGTPGIIVGIPTLVCVCVIMILSTKLSFREVIRLVLSFLFGLLGASLTLVPFLFSFRNPGPLKELLTGAGVDRTFFDLITNMTAGKVLTTSITSNAPNFYLGVGVIVLLLMFLINHNIPFKMRVAGGIVMLLGAVSVSWEGMSRIFSTVVSQAEFIFAVLAGMSFVAVFLAGVQFVNMKNVRRGVVIAACCLILGVVTLSNSSGSNIAPNTFSLIFSWIAVIFWGIVFSRSLENDSKGISVVALLTALAGFSFNMTYTLAPGSFNPDAFATLSSKSESRGYDIYAAPMFALPLFDDGSSYIFLSSDISQSLDRVTPPEVMNMLSNSVFLDDVFTQLQTTSVYVSGTKYTGIARYDTEDPGKKSEMIIRADKGLLVTRCFVFSSFTGVQHLTEIYDEEDRVQTYGSGFFAEIAPPEKEFDLRLAVADTEPGSHEFSVWILDPSCLSELESMVKPFEGNVILLDDHLLVYGGTKSVVTSIPYSDSLSVKSNLSDVRCMNVMGKLAIVFTCEEGTQNVRLKVVDLKTDVVMGTVGSILFVVGSGLLTVKMYNKKKSEDCPERG